MAVAYNLYGGSYDIRTPEETIRGTATIQGKFNVVSNGKTVTLTNPSKATLKYYIQTYGDVTHVGSNQKVAYGSDELFHFVEVPKQIPYNPPVTPDIPTNDGNVCEYWDAPCHLQHGLDWVWGGTEEGIEWVQGGIDEQIKNAQDSAAAMIKAAQDAADKAAKDAQDAFNATIKAAQDAADKAAKDAQDAFDATAKAAADAAAAAAKAAADAAAAAGEGATKGISDTLKIAGVAALGLGVLMVMKK